MRSCESWKRREAGQIVNQSLNLRLDLLRPGSSRPWRKTHNFTKVFICYPSSLSIDPMTLSGSARASRPASARCLKSGTSQTHPSQGSASPAAQTASSQNTFRQWPNEGSPETSIDVCDFYALGAGELIGIILEFRLRYELFQVPESRPEWPRKAFGRLSSFPVADLRTSGHSVWTTQIDIFDKRM
jgi:hypothetical protein